MSQNDIKYSWKLINGEMQIVVVNKTIQTFLMSIFMNNHSSSSTCKSIKAYWLENRQIITKVFFHEEWMSWTVNSLHYVNHRKNDTRITERMEQKLIPIKCWFPGYIK